MSLSLGPGGGGGLDARCVGLFHRSGGMSLLDAVIFIEEAEKGLLDDVR